MTSSIVLPPRPKIKVWCGEPSLYAHAKLDGIMLTVVKDECGIVRAYTRHPIPERGDITERIRSTAWYHNALRGMPFSSAIMGELWRPNHKASDVKSDWAAARFSVFAVPTLDARLSLDVLRDWCRMRYLEFADYRSYDHRLEQFGNWGDLSNAQELGYEGFVLKDGNLLNWRKHKTVKSIDLIVRRVLPGEGAFLGFCGSLELMTNEGYIVGRASGMDWPTRRVISAEDIGRVCEVEYQYVGNRGRLRHPRFVRWRDDKSPRECGVDQDSELETHWAPV